MAAPLDVDDRTMIRLSVDHLPVQPPFREGTAAIAPPALAFVVPATGRNGTNPAIKQVRLIGDVRELITTRPPLPWTDHGVIISKGSDGQAPGGSRGMAPPWTALHAEKGTPDETPDGGHEKPKRKWTLVGRTAESIGRFWTQEIGTG